MFQLELKLKGKSDQIFFIESARPISGMFHIKAVSPEKEFYIPISEILKVEITKAGQV